MSDSNGDGALALEAPGDNNRFLIEIVPLATVLEEELESYDLKELPVVDRSASALSLGETRIKRNYTDSVFYTNLLNDLCHYVVITGNIADLGYSTDPTVYPKDVAALVDALLARSPDRTILILNYYEGMQAAEFTWEPHRLRHEQVVAYNSELSKACAPGGFLHAIEQVTCVDITEPLARFEGDIVYTSLDAEEYERITYADTSFTEAIEAYFSDNPNAELEADGIHLTPAARYVVMGHVADIIAQFEQAEP